MNKQRRKRIRELLMGLRSSAEKLDEICQALESVYDEEDEVRNNIPDNLQSAQTYDEINDACDTLEEALEYLEEVMTNLNSAVDALENM